MTGVLLDGSREAEILSELDAACLTEGVLRVMPAEFYASRSQDDLMVWCVRRGFYCLPTVELVEFLRAEIGGESAIEIGAGHGALGRALGIPMTDSKMQERADIAEIYRNALQAPISYPPDVEKLTALEAVEKYRPRVVIGAWVTHRYDSKVPERGGNMYGVDESKLLSKKWVRRYLFIGHERVCGQKPILSRRHTTYRFPFLFSRASDPLNVIWSWKTR
jgi:hypothetical protein